MNHVVDSSSIEVDRRARRAKSDRLDLVGLLSLLARYAQGDRRAWRVVRVPTVAEEDARHLPRTLETLTQERTRLINRLKGLLATQGVQVRVGCGLSGSAERRRGCGMGRRCRPGCRSESPSGWAQLQHLEAQLRELKATRAAQRTGPADADRARDRAAADVARDRADRRVGAGHGDLRLASDPQSVGNWARWSGWCRRLTRAARQSTTKGSRARAMSTSVG